MGYEPSELVRRIQGIIITLGRQLKEALRRYKAEVGRELAALEANVERHSANMAQVRQQLQVELGKLDPDALRIAGPLVQGVEK